MIPQAVQVLEFVEEVDGQGGDMEDMMRLLFERIHQGKELFAGSLKIQVQAPVSGVSSNAPKRRPRVLTYSSGSWKCCMTAS